MAIDALGDWLLGGMSPGVPTDAHLRKELARLCRYIAGSPIAEKRVSLAAERWVRYQLETSHRNGTTHVVLAPLGLGARLAILVLTAGLNLTRYQGVPAPNTLNRGQIALDRRGKRGHPETAEGGRKESEHLAATPLAQGLKPAIDVIIQTCDACAVAVKVFASIEDPASIEVILAHFWVTGSQSMVARRLRQTNDGLSAVLCGPLDSADRPDLAGSDRSGQRICVRSHCVPRREGGAL